MLRAEGEVAMLDPSGTTEAPARHRSARVGIELRP